MRSKHINNKKKMISKARKRSYGLIFLNYSKNRNFIMINVKKHF